MKKLLAVLAFSFSCASQASMTDILTIHSASSQVQINSDINVAIRTSGGIPMESVIDNPGNYKINVAVFRDFPIADDSIVAINMCIKICI